MSEEGPLVERRRTRVCPTLLFRNAYHGLRLDSNHREADRQSKEIELQITDHKRATCRYEQGKKSCSIDSAIQQYETRPELEGKELKERFGEENQRSKRTILQCEKIGTLFHVSICTR